MKQALASQGKIHAKRKRKIVKTFLKKLLTRDQELGIMSASRMR